MVDLRPVAFVIGLMIAFLGALMAVPLVLDALHGDRNWWAFFQSGFITALTGILMTLSSRNAVGRALTTRQGFLLTVGIWAVLPLFAALPFCVADTDASFTDAYFEAVSGITTTGSTVFAGLDDFSAGLNLWRAMLNWLGGLGIAFVVMIFLPVMRVGGMQFFRAEGFDTLGKILPRAPDIARSLVFVYTALTLACVLTYRLTGMIWFDAVTMGMATIATGGFAPTDLSFGKYAGAPEYAGALFMLLGSLPYVRYVQMARGEPFRLWKDAQVRAYLRWLGYAVGAVTLWRIVTSDNPPEQVFREALFNLTSIFSGTGFAAGSFGGWGSFSMVVALIVGIIGGCSSSSSGALSVFRVQVLGEAIVARMRQLQLPHRLSPVKYDGRTVDDDALNALYMYVYGYLLTIGVMSVLVTFTGVDMESALFGVWTSIGNIGYGYGPMLANTGTFVEFPTSAKWIMIVTMLMGRLALLSVFVLVMPRFWRA